MLKAQSLSKNMGKRSVLTDIDLTLQPGKITAVIGPSGAGKTTLLRAISLIDPPDSGELQIDSMNYHFTSQHNLHTSPWPRITVVFQQHYLWPHLTVRENILLPTINLPHFDKEGLEKLYHELQIESLLDSFPNEISIGERTRVALARAITLKPKYLLLDEITAALDVEQRSSLLLLLLNLKQLNIATLIITHCLDLAAQASDEVLMIDQGRVIERGSTEILYSPRSTRLKSFLSSFQAQQRSY